MSGHKTLKFLAINYEGEQRCDRQPEFSSQSASLNLRPNVMRVLSGKFTATQVEELASKAISDPIRNKSGFKYKRFW